MSGDVPPYVTPAEIAEATGLPRWKVFRKLKRADLLEPDGDHRWHVDASRLRERLPAYYERLFAALVLGETRTNSDELGETERDDSNRTHRG